MFLVSNVVSTILFFMVFTVGFTWAASVSLLASRPPVTKTRITYIDVDDDYEDETPQPSHNVVLPRLTTAQFPPQECNYDLCIVQDVPCSKLAAQTKCYCPGITSPDQIPEAPQLRELKPKASGEVEVHWCAPLSTVTHYQVGVEGSPTSHFGESSRNGTLQGLKVGSRVCVVAVNDAGFSVKNDRSCTSFEEQKSSDVSFKSGIIAGCAGLLVLLSLVGLLLWRRKFCLKSGTLDGEGLGNPSYTTN